jgi:hypothetical protein
MKRCRDAEYHNCTRVIGMTVEEHRAALLAAIRRAGMAPEGAEVEGHEWNAGRRCFYVMLRVPGEGREADPPGISDLPLLDALGAATRLLDEELAWRADTDIDDGDFFDALISQVVYICEAPDGRSGARAADLGGTAAGAGAAGRGRLFPESFAIPRREPYNHQRPGAAAGPLEVRPPDFRTAERPPGRSRCPRSREVMPCPTPRRGRTLAPPPTPAPPPPKRPPFRQRPGASAARTATTPCNWPTGRPTRCSVRPAAAPSACRTAA